MSMGAEQASLSGRIIMESETDTKDVNNNSSTLLTGVAYRREGGAKVVPPGTTSLLRTYKQPCRWKRTADGLNLVAYLFDNSTFEIGAFLPHDLTTAWRLIGKDHGGKTPGSYLFLLDALEGGRDGSSDGFKSTIKTYASRVEIRCERGDDESFTYVLRAAPAGYGLSLMASYIYVEVEGGIKAVDEDGPSSSSSAAAAADAKMDTSMTPPSATTSSAGGGTSSSEPLLQGGDVDKIRRMRRGRLIMNPAEELCPVRSQPSLQRIKSLGMVLTMYLFEPRTTTEDPQFEVTLAHPHNPSLCYTGVFDNREPVKRFGVKNHGEAPYLMILKCAEGRDGYSWTLSPYENRLEIKITRREDGKEVPVENATYVLARAPTAEAGLTAIANYVYSEKCDGRIRIGSTGGDSGSSSPDLGSLLARLAAAQALSGRSSGPSGPRRGGGSVSLMDLLMG
jgi:hypothetical protein